jgi:hypothetical protein
VPGVRIWGLSQILIIARKRRPTRFTDYKRVASAQRTFAIFNCVSRSDRRPLNPESKGLTQCDSTAHRSPPGQNWSIAPVLRLTLWVVMSDIGD